MKKYITPKIEAEQISVTDIIATSEGVTIEALEGVDSGDSKTAVFDANRWMTVY